MTVSTLIYVVYDLATGAIAQTMTAASAAEAQSILTPGQRVLEFEGEGGLGQRTDQFYVKGSLVKPYPVKPHPKATWDLASESWTDGRPLAEMKREKWEEARAIRDRYVFAPVAFAGKSYPADSFSRMRIIEYALQASLTVGALDVELISAGNEVVTLNKAQILSLAKALIDRTARIYKRAQQIAAAIQAATTKVQLDAIDILTE